MRRTPVAVPVLAALAFLLSGVCQAAWLIEIKIPRAYKDLDSRISMSDSMMGRRLNDFKKDYSESEKILRYRASSWKTTASDQQDARKELAAVWGERNIRIIDLSVTPEPEAPAPKPPRPAPTFNAQAAQTALASPGKAFDNSTTRAGNPAPVAVAPQAPAAAPVRMATPAAAPVARAEPPAPVAAKKKKTPLAEIMVAEIIYNESSTLRPQWKDKSPQKKVSDFDPASDQELRKARAMMAIIADKRYGHGVAPATDPPDADQMRNEGVRYTWAATQEAANAAVEDRKTRKEFPEFVMVKGKKRKAPNMDCLHFVNWPSDDPPATPNINKRPTAHPAIGGNPKGWPYTEFDEIKYVFGPFRNPYHGGDVPGGKDVNNIYTFIYCGVPL